MYTEKSQFTTSLAVSLGFIPPLGSIVLYFWFLSKQTGLEYYFRTNGKHNSKFAEVTEKFT